MPETKEAKRPEAAADDAKEIQGTWKWVSGVINGEKDGLLPHTGTIVIGDGKITPVDGPDAGQVGQYRLDASVSPKTIDLTSPQGEVVRGIYSLSGDELRICMGKGPTAARPTKLDSTADPPTMLIVLKRQSREWKLPAAAEPEAKKAAGGPKRNRSSS